MRTNRISKFLLGVTCALFVSFGVAAGAFSFAWFHTVQNAADPRLNGKTAGSYFYAGSGSQTDPFIIRDPIHLYNLAWLNYLGVFIPTDVQAHFRIEAPNGTLDMSNWILPPIGTSKHPFIGILEGNGTTIANLTVTNSYSEITRCPQVVKNAGAITDVEVIGVFGVIGDSGKIGSTSYSSIVPEVKNIYIDSATINTSTATTLVGVAAGYVNGVLEGVGIVNSSVNVAPSSAPYVGMNNQVVTTNLSDYTSIGYCEAPYRKTKTKKTSEIQTSAPVNKSVGGPGDDSGEAGFGGSIDMKTMYTNLDNIWKIVEPISYVSSLTYVDGVLDESQTKITSTKNKKPTNYGFPHYYNNYSQNAPNGKQSASYSFIKDDTASDENYMCLWGESTQTVQNGLEIINITHQSFEAFTIRYGSNNYLSLTSSGSITNNTHINNATKWSNDSSNRIWTNIDSKIFYLRNHGGSLSTSTKITDATSWTQNNGVISNGYHYLNFSNNGWGLADSRDSYVTISSGSNYLNANGIVSLNVGTTAATATKWFKNANGYYVLGGSTKYYVSSNSNSSYAVLVTSSSRALKQNGNYLSYRRNIWSNTYYLNIGSSYPSLTSSSSNASNITFESFTFTPQNFSLASTVRQDVIKATTTQNVTYNTNSTYFPLSGENGVPDDKNTGYVVSGANYTGDSFGDIRVSRFPKYSSLSDSGVNTSQNTMRWVYTIDANGNRITVPSDFSPQYTASKTKLETIFSQDNEWIYGLHFMNAEIGLNNKITVDYAKVNKKEYGAGDNYPNAKYELPEDSINFSLAEAGYINFFAGTYYRNSNSGDNNSFFSLHEVIRNETQVLSEIVEIREISQVLHDATRPSQSYVYKYSDGRYSMPFKGSGTHKKNLDGTPYVEHSIYGTSAPDGYSVLFDTKRIKKQNQNLTMNAAYYFEIPMNDGEFCLGSVNGGIGAYLMYLDIGANAQRVDRTTIAEKKTFSSHDYAFPSGISFVKNNSAAVNEEDSASFALASSFSGLMAVERMNGGGTNDIISFSKLAFITPSFKGENIILKKEDEDVPESAVVGISSSTEVTDSLVMIEYNHQTREKTEKRYAEVNGVRTTTVIITDENNVEGTPEVTNGWDVGIDIDYLVYPLINVTKTNCVYINGLSVTFAITASYAATYDEVNDTTFYSISGYKITITCDVDVVVKVVETPSSYVFFVNGVLLDAVTKTTTVNPT